MARAPAPCWGPPPKRRAGDDAGIAALSEDARRLIAALGTTPIPVRTVAAHLGMRPEDLQTLIVDQYDALTAAGLRPHRATVSEADAAIRLPSTLNAGEPALISKLSLNGRPPKPAARRKAEEV